MVIPRVRAHGKHRQRPLRRAETKRVCGFGAGKCPCRARLRGLFCRFGFQGHGSGISEPLPIGPKVVPFWDYLIEYFARFRILGRELKVIRLWDAGSHDSGGGCRP